jgi:glyoxylase I family protein
MRIEHVAFQVEDPVAVAAWYVEHLGFVVKRSMDVAPFGHFLADDSGRMMIEIYNQPVAAVPSYRWMHSVALHLAFVSADVAADRRRLIAAGATEEGEVVTTAGGDTVAMLRDPWGFAIQLCHRAEPMVG